MEALCGLEQVLGIQSSANISFLMTGNFRNPGPFGGFLAMMMSISGAYIIKYRKRAKGVYRQTMIAAAAVAFCSGLLVLPASMSRAAWISLFIALIAAIASDTAAKSWAKNHRGTCVGLAMVAVILLAGAFFLKKDSALGRLHIWHMEALAIAHNPFGTGQGSAAATYGRTQEQYFKENLDSVPDAIVRVAGCPEYSFNEYLHVGMEFGIPGMLLFITLLGAALHSLLKSRNTLAYGLISWMVFAFASYPLSVPRINLLLGILLVSAVFDSRMKAAWKYPLAMVAACLSVALFVNSGKNADFRTIYDIGHAQFVNGDYSESIETLSEGASQSSDPMFHVMMGRSYEALGDYTNAEKEYWTARYMVPCRIYPLVRLTRLYVKNGDNDAAFRCAEQAAGMPIKEGHVTMSNLQKEICVTLDSLKSCR